MGVDSRRTSYWDRNLKWKFPELSRIPQNERQSENSTQYLVLSSIFSIALTSSWPKKSYPYLSDGRPHSKNPPSARYSHCQYVFVWCWILERDPEKNQKPVKKITGNSVETSKVDENGKFYKHGVYKIIKIPRNSENKTRSPLNQATTRRTKTCKYW